jgi:mannitol-specific phosphotransferase system IIBC component
MKGAMTMYKGIIAVVLLAAVSSVNVSAALADSPLEQKQEMLEKRAEKMKEAAEKKQEAKKERMEEMRDKLD